GGGGGVGGAGGGSVDGGGRGSRRRGGAPAEGSPELRHDVGTDDGLELLPDDAGGPREGLPLLGCEPDERDSLVADPRQQLRLGRNVDLALPGHGFTGRLLDDRPLIAGELAGAG